MKQTKIENFNKDLLNWYDLNKKLLPWRMTLEPYKIWISEIMSQQTQVETVIPYYKRFIDKYPTLRDLAEADDAELLKLWEGLGYYSRVRNLKSGAQQVMNEFGGKFPTQINEIRSIKGIGPYSAASISSISFNAPEPAIDGNLFRVTSRLFEISDDISKSSSRKIFDEKLRMIISQDRPGDFNQALMDVGATICHPKSPKCDVCPLRGYCQSFQTGDQEKFPVKSKKIKQKQLYYQAFAIKLGDKYLMVKRPSAGLLADMWTFPLVEVEENAEVILPSELRNQIVKFEEIGEISHIFSHLKWHVRLIVCQLEDVVAKDGLMIHNQAWLSEKDLKTRALAGPQIKLFKLLKNN